MTLGDRNNNPLNIRSSSPKGWIGQIGIRKGFAVFKSKSYGIRAAIILLKRSYIPNGFNTVEKIIKRWAPEEDNNDTYCYIKAVEKLSPLKATQRIKTDDEICYLIRAMAKVESLLDFSTAYIKDVMIAFNLQSRR